MNRDNWFPIVMVVFACSLMGTAIIAAIWADDLPMPIVQEFVESRDELDIAIEKLEKSVRALSATFDKAIANQEALNLALDRLNKRLSEGTLP